MKTPLGMEVDLIGPGHIVLDGDPRNGHSSSHLLSARVYLATVAHFSYCWALGWRRGV